MALFDALFEFSDNQAITASAAATNVIDMQAADLEMGAGQPMYLNVRVGGTAFDSAADDGTLTVALVSDTDATIDGSSIVTIQTKAVAEATLVAGEWVTRVSLPVNFDDNRYVGLYYTVAGSGDFTAGTIDAWIDNGPQSSFDTQVSRL